MGDLVEKLRDPNYRGELQHLRPWSEIDALFMQAAAVIEAATDEEALARVLLSAEGWLPEEVECLARGGPTWNRALRIARAIISHITEAPHG